MSETAKKRPLGGRMLLALLVLSSTCILLSRAAAFPDWTDCPAVCSCKWTSGKKSAFCPDAGLTSLPASLDPDMQVLDLSGNKIPALQSEIFKRFGLVNLQKVFLRNAGIYEIDCDAFKDMRILIEVDLSDNHITELKLNTFLGNERLRVLTLSGNPLIKLKNQQFPLLQHLRTLELQRCIINQIDNYAFINLPGLESLKLDGNQLTYLEVNTISMLKNLKTLTLDANKWSCDCRLKKFRKWLIPEPTPKKLYSVSQICSQPIHLRGQHWEDIKPSDFACLPTVQLYASTIQEDINANLSLSCHITGDPLPELIWHFNGNPLNFTRSDSTNPSGSIIVTLSSNHSQNKIPERWSNITIYNASEIDTGEYICEGENIAGRTIDTKNIIIPHIFKAPTLSQTDNWFLWISLAGGGIAAFFAFISALLLVMCMCGNSRKQCRREKVKLQSSTSYGDQEKKLLDLSVTTATSVNPERSSCHDSFTETCSPGDIELIERTSLCDATAVTVERLRPECARMSSRNLPCSGFPPPPPEFTGGPLPSGLFGNIFISVALPTDVERCYPDLLDIPGHASSLVSTKCSLVNTLPATSIISSFATLPRRSLRSNDLMSSQYDNMGPRVTATGSSTFSLTDDLRLSPPLTSQVIKPPIEFVSL